MQVWLDTKTKRIMAMYVNCETTSNIWIEKGYILYEKITPDMLPIIEPPEKKEYNRLEKLLIEKGIITKEDLD